MQSALLIIDMQRDFLDPAGPDVAFLHRAALTMLGVEGGIFGKVASTEAVISMLAKENSP